jgi:hypothetical protein
MKEPYYFSKDSYTINQSYMGSGSYFVYEIPSSSWNQSNLNAKFVNQPIYFIDSLADLNILFYNMLQQGYLEFNVVLPFEFGAEEYYDSYYYFMASNPDNWDFYYYSGSVKTQDGTTIKTTGFSFFRLDGYDDSAMLEMAGDFVASLQGQSDRDKVIAIHRYIVLNTAYDMNAFYSSDSQDYWNASSAYSSLINHKAMCLGYAKAFYVLAREAGLPVLITSGMAGVEEHAWNLVYLDNAWYQVDATWDDPTPDVSGRVLEDYLLRPVSYGPWSDHRYVGFAFDLEQYLDFGNAIYGLNK